MSWPHGTLQELTKVDILNCMGVAMLAFSAAACFGAAGRLRIAAIAGLAIAAASPVVAQLDWGGAPALVRQYLAPGSGAGYFPFFPYASHLGFGMAAGTLVKRAEGRMERLMLWCALMGLALVVSGQYLANIPYSIYNKSNFWTDSPILILMNLGIMEMLLSLSYLWTEFGADAAWSWMQCLGKNSLMVYWVHLMLVYGELCRPLHRNLSIAWTAIAAVTTTALMVGLSASWIWWKTRRAGGPIRSGIS
jgi:peptidoglycan/LPS O-acetylase OafA/YrhL